MTMTKRVLKSRTITVDDYYSERFLRIEEELKHQRELMKIGFDTMNKRFEEMRIDMNLRFQSVDKRFEEMRGDMILRFQSVDKRFEEMRGDMNLRFESIDRRFDLLTRRMDRFMIWSFGVTLTCTGLMISAMKYWR